MELYTPRSDGNLNKTNVKQSMASFIENGGIFTCQKGLRTIADNRTLEQTIALQTESAVASLRSLRSEVKQVTDEWKLQNAQLRQNGDYEEAYQTKVNGL